MNAPRSHRAGRRNRWPWVVTLLLGIVGLAGAVVRNRSQSLEAERFAVRSAEPLTRPHRDEVSAGSPIGNGVVRAQHRPGGND